METPESTLPPIVYIVEDDPAVRQSLRWMLQGESMEVRNFGSAEEVIGQIDSSRIGCLVLDLRLPTMTGLELYQELLADGCRLPFIIVTGNGDVPDAVSAIRQGAIDFLLKPLRMELFLETVHSAIQADRHRRETERQQRTGLAKLQALTPREREVLDLVANGRMSKNIALELQISIKTVEAHRANIMRKLDVNSIAELVRLVLETSEQR